MVREFQDRGRIKPVLLAGVGKENSVAVAAVDDEINKLLEVFIGIRSSHREREKRIRQLTPLSVVLAGFGRGELWGENGKFPLVLLG